MTVEVVPSRVTHIGPIASRIRDIDRIECEAMGDSPKRALRQGFLLSDICMTALVDGRPEAMFGAITLSAVSGEGTAWMLGTDAIYRHPRELIREGPAIVRRLVDSSGSLSNLVSSANGQAIRLLERWGFTVEHEEQVVRGVPFRHFWIKRDV